MAQRPPDRRTRSLALAATLVCGAFAASAAPAPRVDWSTLALQVALDRAGVSPGVIDGRPGTLTTQALTTLQHARGLEATGVLDDGSRAVLKLDAESPTQPYTITAADLEGPFVPAIPADLMAQGKLPGLSYTSVVELIAERFHTEVDALRRLNPEARFTEGDTINVPNVEPMIVPAKSERRRGSGPEAARMGTIVVSKSPALVMAMDAGGALLFAAPVTSGSEHDPLPIGEWKVTDVYLLPMFHYNPALFWDADPSHAKTSIKPGPNSPVGIAWIDLDREHYGIHGTPEPRIIGRSTSHGCVRLTNWDVARLLAFVALGTRVIFSEQAIDPVPVS
jgi:lipoprotein-anchoring transpeptidase ErfK/SrfK